MALDQLVSTGSAILFGPTSKAKIAFVQLDVSIREMHSAKSRVTRHPIEDGSTVSDHVVHEPDGLTMEGFITDSPVRFLSGVRAILEGPPDIGAIPEGYSPAAAEVNPGDNGVSRAREAYRAIMRLKASGKPLTVKTGLRTYNNLIIESIDVPRDVDKSGALFFTAVFTQVQIVNSLSVAIPKDILSAAKSATAASKVAEGRKNTQAATAVTKQKTTFLYDFGNWVRNLFKRPPR
jgi:hypothetical protein